jgi:hypothetical protein
MKHLPKWNLSYMIKTDTQLAETALAEDAA